MRVAVCVIARTTSTRLPGKVLRDVSPGVTMIDYILARMRVPASVTDVYLCTSTDASDDVLEDVAARQGAAIFRGQREEVIQRMLGVVDETEAECVVRVTGDNVFTAFEYIDRQVELLDTHGLDYVRLCRAPLGAAAEVMTSRALRHCYERIDPKDSEYLLLYLFDPGTYRCGVLRPSKQDWSRYSLTVDTPEDLERTRQILRSAGDQAPSDLLLEHIVELLRTGTIPSSEIAPDQPIRMPRGQTVTFRDILASLAEREAQAAHVEYA